MWYNYIMHDIKIKRRVIELRKNCKTYGEINKIIGLNLPKSTLSDWCNNILLSRLQKEKLKEVMDAGSEKGRIMAHIVLKERREKYLKSIEKRVYPLSKLIKNKEVAKIAAGILYLGEGSKTLNGHFCLGNSNPGVITLFLYLLRNSYKIDEKKFRCTVQCRADQNTKELEKFWSNITKIPLNQFYKSRIDPRTIGKPSKKLDYKGVCRLEYFSADLFLELMEIGNLMCKTGR